MSACVYTVYLCLLAIMSILHSLKPVHVHMCVHGFVSVTVYVHHVKSLNLVCCHQTKDQTG